MFSTVSIMPGIDCLAPEREETRSGFFGSPNFMPIASSIVRRASVACFLTSSGIFPFSKNRLQMSVAIVNPGGTGSPRSVAAANEAPFPPSLFFMDALPSALPLANLNTDFSLVI